ncbi:MAG: DUF308 domain-containing protein [Bacteroidales bacterium]|nr:DUF308 domain-containing protein [Bacteroidales bacterium]
MLTRSIFRALCALLVGFLLVSNPTDMTILLVQIIGGLFALSGLVAVIGYFINAQQVRRAEHRLARQTEREQAGLSGPNGTAVVADSQNKNAASSARSSSRWMPMFPVVGIGSMAFGVFLLFFPKQFVNYLMYVLGGLLVLIGVMQVFQLIRARRFAPLSWSLFLLPLLNIAAGVLVICYPMETASLPFTILGVGYILYGVSEFFFGVRFYHFRRLFEAEQLRLQEEAAAAEAAAEAEFVEAEEVSASGSANGAANGAASETANSSASGSASGSQL